IVGAVHYAVEVGVAEVGVLDQHGACGGGDTIEGGAVALPGSQGHQVAGIGGGGGGNNAGGAVPVTIPGVETRLQFVGDGVQVAVGNDEVVVGDIEAAGDGKAVELQQHRCAGGVERHRCAGVVLEIKAGGNRRIAEDDCSAALEGDDGGVGDRATPSLGEGHTGINGEGIGDD